MKDRIISVKLPNELVNSLDEIAHKRYGGNRSALIQTILLEFVENEKEGSIFERVDKLEKDVSEIKQQLERIKNE